ncbi:TonB-dependent receptor [Caulobacter sp. Root487D2Y]|uniref:TonB-dependent receptor n=1 Tax=Caulobacter sp. Root487D2Y TaxID=1736547 RepID=UPI0006F97EDA|nr:TonB-dependent receptor [Caulobacter sp. Root487D2Y]KQY31230.1 TonB-dependent receptor [Caulobacter sp. Root487D2Y]
MPFDSPPPVEQVIVTAARLPPAAAEAAFSAVHLSERDLATTQRVDEAISRTPGVSLFRRTSSLSANPTTQGISLRAIAPSGAGRTLVTLDGVPLNDPFGGWVIWSQLAPESLSGVDIVRGAGAGPYGAGALTGVIGLKERDAGIAGDVSVGELGSRRASAAAVSTLGRFEVFGAALYDKSDGYVPVRGDARGAADTRTDLEAKSISGRIDMATGLGLLSLRGGFFEEDRGAGLVGARANASGNVLSATLVRAPRGQALGWRLQAWRRTSDLFNSSVAVAADRSFTTPANSQDKTPATGWGLNGALRQKIGGVEWELGADARLNDGEERERYGYSGGTYTRDRVAGGKTSVVGAYADGSWTTGPWLVAGGLRLDHWETTDGFRVERNALTGAVLVDRRPADRDGEVVSGRLGVTREIAGDAVVRLAGYTGFRPASLNELYRPFRVGNDVTEANAALEPERLEGLEAGVSRKGAKGLIEATAFWNRIEDPIVNVTLGAGPATFPIGGFIPAGGVLRQRQNAGTIDAVGLEGRADRKVGAVTLSSALSVTDARVDGGSTAPQLTGKRPAQAPIWSATAGLSAELTDRLTLATDLTWEGKRFEDDLNSRVLDPAYRLDARLNWRVRPLVTAYVAGDNLLDANIQTSRTADGVAGYAAPRVVRVGLRLAI